MEVRDFFLSYITDSTSSPQGIPTVSHIFARDEYQKDTENLSHIHLILCIKAEEGKDPVNTKLCDIMPTYVTELIRTKDIPELVESGLLKN